MKFISIACVIFAASLAAASPVQNEVRDVWTPHMTVPNAGTVWKSGTTQTVRWDTSDAPQNITGGNNSGYITLRFGEIESPVVLAHGINLRAGHVRITVPQVFTGNDYSLVLFGDSGNWSPSFTIQGY